MNNRFIETCHSILAYQKKVGTKGSFYQSEGKRDTLPNRLSIGIFAQRRSSNMDFQKKNEINASYKKSEEGLYKHLNKGRVHTSIWFNPDYPEFYGYGIIDERFNIYDLIIIYSSDNITSSFEIHLFRGLGLPEYKKRVFQYLRLHKNKSPNK